MKDFVLENLTDLADLSLSTVLLNNCVALLVAFFIMLTYWMTFSGTAYSKKFNVTLGMLTLLTTLIMSVISNNIALSLGMVGALSIIRFRTAVKDSRDATYIFWSIAVGIGCGVSQYLLVAISSVVVFLFLLVMNQAHPDGKLLIIVRSTLAAQSNVDAAIRQHFDHNVRQKMKNADTQSCEQVYEISLSNLKKSNEKRSVDIVEKLIKIEGVQNVNQVEQTDDINR
jgi:uncharacterized membrane protein YhiD involved in acid resistance